MSTGQVQTSTFAAANFQLNFNAAGSRYANFIVRGANPASAFQIGGSSVARLGAGVAVGPVGVFRNYYTTHTAAVPEPTLPTIFLLGLGAAGVAAYRQRKAA